MATSPNLSTVTIGKWPPHSEHVVTSLTNQAQSLLWQPCVYVYTLVNTHVHEITKNRESQM